MNPTGRENFRMRNAGSHTQHIVPGVISLDNLLRMDDVLVVHNEDCGSAHRTEDKLKTALRERSVGTALELEALFEKFDFGYMTDQTLASSCKEDVEFLTCHPWIRPETSGRG